MFGTFQRYEKAATLQKLVNEEACIRTPQALETELNYVATLTVAQNASNRQKAWWGGVLNHFDLYNRGQLTRVLIN